MDIYGPDSNYIRFVTELNNDNLVASNFKSKPEYSSIMDNISKELGQMYLTRIETEFPEIEYYHIRKFINTNDAVGGAIKCIYTTSTKKLLYCNPSNMRYIYLALLILFDMRLTGCTSIVELGAGYGGMMLAINAFCGIMGVDIKKYYIVDLPQVTTLINNYLEINKDDISIPYEIRCGFPLFGDDIVFESEKKIYLISNYCFTEMDISFRRDYALHLFPKITHGFLVWQTCTGIPVESAVTEIRREVRVSEPERPQTGPSHAINYFVYI
jgi:hypothetical protein